MSTQRTLLPYRLAVSLRMELILDEVRWHGDNSYAEALLDVITRRTPGWDVAVLKLQTLLNECVEETLAAILVDDLIDAVAAVWLFEQEYKFERGFALIPRKEVLHA